MLIGEIFDEFIHVIHENQKYTIGMISDEKEITLCSDKSLIGRSLDYNHPNKNNVFFEIVVQGQEFGYLWVNGKEDSLQMIGNLLYESLTIRLMFEINQKNLKRKITKDDELVRCLLDEENFDMAKVLSLLNDLGLDAKKPRVAIYLISNEEDIRTQDVMCLKMGPDSREIFYSLLNERTLLIFRDIPEEYKENDEIRKFILRYIKQLKELDFTNCYFYIGTIQHKMRQYIHSYQSCLWLREHMKATINSPLFFNDYLTEYFLMKIDAKDVESVYNYYIETGKEIDCKELIEISEALMNNDFNLTQTAEDLFLHKNTLIYKIKKYEEIFQMDIRGSFQGKILLLLISRALKERSNLAQVGD